MDREMDQFDGDDLIDLGAVSTETKGISGGGSDTYGQQVHGLIDD